MAKAREDLHQPPQTEQFARGVSDAEATVHKFEKKTEKPFYKTPAGKIGASILAAATIAGGAFALGRTGSEATPEPKVTNSVGVGGKEAPPIDAEAQPDVELPPGAIYEEVPLPIGEAKPGEPEGAEIVRTLILVRAEAFKTNNVWLLEQFWKYGPNNVNFMEDLKQIGPEPDPLRVPNPRHLVVDKINKIDTASGDLIEGHYHYEINGQPYMSDVASIDNYEGRWMVGTLDSQI